MSLRHFAHAEAIEGEEWGQKIVETLDSLVRNAGNGGMGWLLMVIIDHSPIPC